jgi:hypothetical protein
MLIARAFSGFLTWIKLYINSCKFLKNGPLCGPLTFDRSPNMVRRSAHLGASFFDKYYKEKWYNKKHQRRKHMSRVGFVRNSIYEKGLKKMARA